MKFGILDKHPAHRHVRLLAADLAFRMPFVGALLTNGTTPTQLAMGLSRLGPAYMHVSPGLGTSKYAPFRFLCRPEATYLELLPQPSAASRADRESAPRATS